MVATRLPRQALSADIHCSEADLDALPSPPLPETNHLRPLLQRRPLQSSVKLPNRQVRELLSCSFAQCLSDVVSLPVPEDYTIMAKHFSYKFLKEHPRPHKPAIAALVNSQPFRMSEIDGPSLLAKLWKLFDKSRTFQEMVVEERPWVFQYQVCDTHPWQDSFHFPSENTLSHTGWSESQRVDRLGIGRRRFCREYDGSIEREKIEEEVVDMSV